MTFQKYFIFFFSILLLLGRHAEATSSVWQGPGSDFNTASNWSAGVPADVAEFKSATPTNISITQNTGMATGMLFDPGAASYTININGVYDELATVNGIGFTNNSGVTQTINLNNNGHFLLNGDLTGSMSFVMSADGIAYFTNNTSVSGSLNYSITQNGLGVFSDDVAQNAFFDNEHGTLSFTNSDVTGSTIRNGSAVVFYGTSTAVNLTVFNTQPSSTLDISPLTNSQLTMGGLNGMGSVILSSHTLTIGSDNSDSNFAGVMSGMGGSLQKIGSGTLILTGANTYTGGTTVSQGILKGNATSLQGDIVNNAQLEFNQNIDGTYSGVLSGAGQFYKSGLGTLTLANTNTFSGSTFVEAGALNVTGSLSGAIMTDYNAILSGTGTVAALTNDGIVSPGSGQTGSLQTSSYTGSGFLAVHENGLTTTSLQVTGDATLTGGTLRLISSRFAAGSLDVVHSGLIVGTFDSLEFPSAAFFKFAPQYTATDVVIQVSSLSFTAPAHTSNQRAVGGALDASQSVASGSLASSIYPALYQLSRAEAPGALQQMSGDSLPSFQDVAFHQMDSFMQQIHDREVPMDSAGVAAPIDAADASAADVRAMGGKTFTSEKQGLWARGLGSFDHRKSDDSSGAPGFSDNAGGFQVGYDHTLGDLALLGASLGYTRAGLSVDDGSSGNANVLDLGVYGHYEPGPWFFDAVMAYGHDSNSMSRDILLGDVDDVANSNFSSNLFTLGADAGYAFEPWTDTALEPFWSLKESFLSQGAFSESGAPGLNLNVADTSVNSFVSTLGVGLHHLYHAETRHPFKLGARLGWGHDFGNTDREISAAFVDAPGASFTTEGVAQPRDAMDVGFDGRIALSERLQAYLNYNSAWSTQEISNEFFGGMRWKW